MAPGGGGFLKEATEFCIASADSDLATSDAELGSSIYRNTGPGLGRNLGRPASNYDVHELLECPVCMNLMHPPIYQVFNCFGRQFCLHFEAFHLEMAPVYMAFLRFMGEEEEAKQFSYSLEVGGNGRKLTWKGIPRSIRDSHKKVRDSQDGLIIQRNLALFFSGGNMKELKLRLSGRIWEVQ